MKTPLDPGGRAVAVGSVTIRTPGISGEATIRRPGDGQTRGRELGTKQLLEAMEQSEVREDFTLELTGLKPKKGQGGSAGNRARRATPAEHIELEVPSVGKDEGQFLLRIAEDGVTSWHFPEKSAASAPPPTRRGRRTAVYRIPGTLVATPPASTTSRGVASTVASIVLKFIVFPVIAPSLKKAGTYYSSKFEKAKRLERWREFGPGDFTVQKADAIGPQRWRELAKGPALLFVHGTGAMSHTAFARLDGTMDELARRYEGRVFALDHFTISVDPAANARIAAEQIPPGVDLEVDIVCHSRGGLVAREFAERGVSSGIRVRRLVMVGTPNAGTAIAQRKNLTRWLDTMTNIAQFLPDNPVTDILAVVLTVAKHVALEVFEGLEGLTSMDPDGTYLEELNVDGEHATQYFAVAADFEPVDGSALKRVHDTAMDVLFSKARNDLVVPTAGVAAVKGLSRFAPTSLVLDETVGVDHFSFFGSPIVREKLLDWLPG